MVRFLKGIFLLVLAGCAPHHFVARQGNGVAIYLDAPRAITVVFASSLDSFQLHPTQKNAAGLWLTTILNDREFRYFYVVDGRVYVPDCKYREQDDFGATNCIYQP